MSSKTRDGNYDLGLLAGDRSYGQNVPKIRPLAEIERAYIIMAVELCNGNIPQAAGHLGISPSTIYRKKMQWAAKGEQL